MEKQPKVSIITLVAQRPVDEVKKYFDSVSKLNYPNFELILVINNDDKKYAKNIILLASHYSKIQIINNHKNLGFCVGTNIGIKTALENKSLFTLLLNDDVIVKRNLIEELLLPFQDKKIGLVSPLIMQYPDSKKIWYAGGYMSKFFAYSRTCGINKKFIKTIKSGPTNIISGCCVMVKKEVWQKIGLLDEDLFMYFDDPDISIRAYKYGFVCYFVAKPLVIHLKQSAKLNPLEAYYFARNPYILINKHYKGYKKMTAHFGQLAIRFPRNLIRLKNNKSFFSYLRGIRDGIRLIR